MRKQLLLLTLSAFYVGFFSPLRAIIDNRYLVPFLEEKFFLFHPSPTGFSVQPFLTTANKSYSSTGDDTLPLFCASNGNYDQRAVDKALIDSGRTTSSLFRSDWQRAITVAPWLMQGRFEVYGTTFSFLQDVTDWFSYGFFSSYMHALSCMEMARDSVGWSDNAILGPGDEHELFLTKEEMSDALGVQPPFWTTTCLGDIDVFVRFFTQRAYKYKFKHLDFGLAAGCIIPTAPKRDVNNPASVPLGGNGHWGLYLAGDCNLVVKEDINAGFMLQLQKRLRKTDCFRMPIGKEPINYGSVVGQAEVVPGMTVGFRPYLQFEGLRDGLGFWLSYSLSWHDSDSWRDKRDDTTVPVALYALQQQTAWGSEHVTLAMCYDAGYDNTSKGAFKPFVSINWDIPVDWTVAKNSFKTHGISLLIQMSI